MPAGTPPAARAAVATAGRAAGADGLAQIMLVGGVAALVAAVVCAALFSVGHAVASTDPEPVTGDGQPEAVVPVAV